MFEPSDICYSRRSGLAKVRYASKAKAEQARIKLQSRHTKRRKLEVYACPLNGGNHFHLRTKKPARRWDEPEVRPISSVP